MAAYTIRAVFEDGTTAPVDRPGSTYSRDAVVQIAATTFGNVVDKELPAPFDKFARIEILCDGVPIMDFRDLRFHDQPDAV